MISYTLYSPYVKQALTLIISFFVYYITIKISGIEFLGKVGIEVVKIGIFSSILTLGFQENSSYLYVEKKIKPHFFEISLIALFLALVGLSSIITNIGQTLFIIAGYSAWRLIEPFLRFTKSYENYFIQAITLHFLGSAFRISLLIEFPDNINLYLIGYYFPYLCFLLINLLIQKNFSSTFRFKSLQKLDKEWFHLYVGSLIVPFRQLFVFNYINISSNIATVGEWSIFNKFLDILQNGRVELIRKFQKRLLNGNNLKMNNYSFFILFSIAVYFGFIFYKSINELNENFLKIYFFAILAQILWLIYFDRQYYFLINKLKKSITLILSVVNTMIFYLLQFINLSYETYIILLSVLPAISTILLVNYFKFILRQTK